MQKIIDYMVITKYTIPELQENVLELIKGNWQPLGGAFQSVEYNYVNQVKVSNTKFNQTMIYCEERMDKK